MTKQEFLSALVRRAGAAGASVPSEMAERLWIYLELLVHWNRRMNLVGFALDPINDAAIDRLFVEPLQAAAVLGPVDAFIDIGSGGGSPGIPLFLALPSKAGILVEVRTRKGVFLREVVRALELLSQIDVQTKTFQELASTAAWVGGFDLCTVRAVRVAGEDFATLRRFLRPRGRLCLFSAGEPEVETMAGFSVEHMVELQSANPSKAIVLRIQLGA